MGECSAPWPVFVTGAGGLIGSAVVKELDGRSVGLRALLAPRESDANLRGIDPDRIVRCDVRGAKALAKAAAGCASVIHCAALNKLWHKNSKEFYATNVNGTKNALDAAVAAGARRFVFVSSCEVMGPALPGPPADETRTLDARRVKGHYEMSKFISERQVHAYGSKGLEVIVIRPTAVIGSGDIHGTPPARLIGAFLEGSIGTYYDAGINVVDSRDVAIACANALTMGEPGQAYIVGGSNITLSELFERLARTSGRSAPRRRVGYGVALAAAYVKEAVSLFTGTHPGITVSGIRTIRHPWFFDCAKARRELELDPRPLDETLRNAVAWHLKSGIGDQGPGTGKQTPGPGFRVPGSESRVPREARTTDG